MIKHLNTKNFNTLLRALRSEPLPVIWRNLWKKLRSASEGSLVTLVDKDLDLFFTVDHILYSEKSEMVTVLGWSLTPIQKTQPIVKVNGQPVEIWFYRADVFDAEKGSEGKYHINAGFFYAVPCESDLKSLQVEMTYLGDRVFSKNLPVRKMQSFEHLSLSRNQQYGIYESLKSKVYQRPSATNGPLISVVVPVYNVSMDYLKACVDSVLAQSYQHWQLCLCNDASTRRDTIAYLKHLEGSDPRILIHHSTENGNISVATNKAIAMAEGEYIALLDHDDMLHPDALAHTANAIASHPEADIFYSDEDKLDIRGQRVEPYYKPSWSKHLLLANNYICHFLTVRKTLGDQVGWLREGYEGAQDHDFLLRLTDVSDQVVHIPHILYHWRKIEGSTALGHSEKSYANKAGVKAVNDYVKRNQLSAKVKTGDWTGAYRIKYQLRSNPRVAIIIPFKDQVHYLKKCVNSIFEKTQYQNYEIILVDNQSEEKATADYLQSISVVDNVRLLTYSEAFNYSKINNYAVSKTDAEVVLLLNNDIEVITKGWLKRMLSLLQCENVGAVGAQLLYDDKTSQHSGLVMGIGGVAGHAFKAMPTDTHHYYLDGLPREVSGCTAACLMLYRSIFLDVGGLNGDDLKVAFNDVDLCLKIRKAGHLILYVSDVQLYHYESKSRGYEDTPEKIARFKREEAYMKETWGETLLNDPYYNPNLSLIRQDFGLNIEGLLLKYREQISGTVA